MAEHIVKKGNGMLVLTVPEDPEEVRAPLRLIVGMDVSFSMNSPAVCKGENGEDKNQGWSNLDINKHGLLTCLAMMQDGDHIAIVEFHTNASIVIDWTETNAQGKERVEAAVRAMTVKGQTNLTACLDLVGTLMARSPHEERTDVRSAFVLYTDGNPTTGMLPSNEAYAEKLRVHIEQSGVDYTTITLGIGNEIDSRLLHGLGDRFLHILYTQFLMAFTVHMMASLMTSVRVHLENHQSVTAHKGIPLHILLPRGSGSDTGSVDDDEEEGLQEETLRVRSVKALRSGMPSKIKECMEDTHMWPELYATLSEAVLGLEKYRHSWGQHYVRSISDALESEVKTNLLDDAVAKYTSRTFQAFVDMGCDAFAEIRPPQPSLLYVEQSVAPYVATGVPVLNNEVSFRSLSSSTTPSFVPPPPSLASQTTVTTLPDEFLRGGGCMSPDTPIMIFDFGGAKTVPVKELLRYRKDHFPSILTSKGYRDLECIVVTSNRTQNVVPLDDRVALTEWHPVRSWLLNTWVFARELTEVPPKEYPQPSVVINLVMKERHPIYLQGATSFFEYATLGHSRITGTDDSVAYHDYWATERSINDLKQMPGYHTTGVVILDAALPLAPPSSRPVEEERNCVTGLFPMEMEL